MSSSQLISLEQLARQMTYETPLKPAADIGLPGEFAWIETRKLYVDPSYQRPIMENGKKNIRQVTETFHYSKFGALLVTRRGKDRYAVLDGQHHGIAALLHPKVKRVPCLIQKCTPEQEADVFATVNSLVTRVHSLHLFRARVAGGDKMAGAVARACKAAGVSVCPYPKADLQPGETMAAGRIERCIQRYGAEVTTMALSLIVRANAGDEKGSLLNQGMIVGIAAVLFANPKWQKPERLFQAVSERGLRDLLKRAMQRQASKGGSVHGGVSAVLAEMLQPLLGVGGGDKKQQKTLGQKAREEARRTHEFQRVLVRSAATPAKPVKADTSASDRAAIDAFLKSKGARKFESGATGNTAILLEWLERVCGISCRRLPPAQGPRGRIYLIGKKKHDLAGLLAVVNEERRKRKLQPITSGG